MNKDIIQLDPRIKPEGDNMDTMLTGYSDQVRV